MLHFRFGHSQVNTHLWRFEEDGTMSHYGHLALRDAYFSPERVSREGGIEPLFRGAVRQAAQEVDLKVKASNEQPYKSLVFSSIMRPLHTFITSFLILFTRNLTFCNFVTRNVNKLFIRTRHLRNMTTESCYKYPKFFQEDHLQWT